MVLLKSRDKRTAYNKECQHSLDKTVIEVNVSNNVDKICFIQIEVTVFEYQNSLRNEIRRI